MTTTLFESDFVGKSPQAALEFIVSVLQSSTDYSIIGKGLDGRILLWNEGARRLYGYEAEELLGKARSDILHTPEDVAAGGGEISWAARVRARRHRDREPGGVHRSRQHSNRKALWLQRARRSAWTVLGIGLHGLDEFVTGAGGHARHDFNYR
jgi:PAS domain-containing protein